MNKMKTLNLISIIILSIMFINFCSEKKYSEVEKNIKEDIRINKNLIKGLDNSKNAIEAAAAL